MKKILILSVLVMIIIMPLSGAVNITKSSENNTNASDKIVSNEDSTHAVLAEYGTLTTCPYCPAASSQLYDIYDSGDYDFYYVSLVFKVGSDITTYRVSKRAYDELGITSVPDVYFDGKYTHVLGEQDDDQPYRNKITTGGSRDVADIDLDVEVVWQGNAVLKITVTVQNNEPEDYNGHLRVYVVEPVSRWDDQQGNPYHFGVLDIPIDRPLAVSRSLTMQQDVQPCPLGDTYEFSRTWFGSLCGYNDITQDNIMVIAAVFDKNTDYTVQTASAKPADTYVPLEDGYTNVTVEEAWEMLNDPSPENGIQIPIDVRTVEEWNLERIDTPAPEDPLLWADLQHGIGLQEFIEEYADKEILLYCRSGNRSFIATKLLIDNGFTGTIYQMIGGIKAWQRAGYPTVPIHTLNINVCYKDSSTAGTVTIKDNDYPIYSYDVTHVDAGRYKVEVPAGEYDITVSDVEDCKSWTKTVEVEKDMEISFNFPKGKDRVKSTSPLIFQLLERLFGKQLFPILNALLNL